MRPNIHHLVLTLAGAALVGLSGCAHIDPPRPFKTACAVPKVTALERATAVFISKGYKITMTLPETGLLTAERDEFSAWDGGWKFVWTLQTDGASITTNARQIHGIQEHTFDRTNYLAARGNGEWFSSVMSDLDAICGQTSGGTAEGARSE